MFKKFRRAIAGTTSVAVVAGMVATGAVTGVVATATPAAAAIPTPGDNQAIISVKVGGVRPTQDATPTGRSGVKLELFNDNSGSVGTSTGLLCTSDSSGDCNFTVDQAGLNKRYWVRLAANNPWVGEGSLVTGGTQNGVPAFELTRYQFRTPTVVGGQTYESTKTGSNGFMRTANPQDGSNEYVRNVSSGVWQSSLSNPAFPPKCGIKVALVLDLSGSVSPFLPQLKTAAQTFVNSLVGTPSQVAGYTFAANAPRAGTTNLGLTSVATATGPDSAATVNTWISGLSSGGGTNWDRGMFQVAASSDQYDVAVVITDGNPTFYANEQGPGDMTRFIEMENSVFSANAIKNKNTRVIAVGVGDGIDGNPANLKAISGTVKFEENVTPPETADFFQTTDFEEAGKALKALAESSCQGSINVFKKVLPWNGTGLSLDPPTG